MKPLLKSRYILIFLISIFLTTNSYADIIKLIDDTVIQGKVVREDERVYFFTNADGTFEIKKVYVGEIIITNSYKEDIASGKKHQLSFNLKRAKANYEAGMRKQMLMSKNQKKKKKYYEYWDYGRLSVSVSYFGTISEEASGKTSVSRTLPNGFSGQLTYEQGLDMLLDHKKGKKKKKKKKRNEIKSRKKYRRTKPRPPMMPGLRVEWSYMYFTKDVFVDDDKEVSGSMYTVGPMWCFPSPHNVWGCIMFAVMPGYSFMRINNREAKVIVDNYAYAMTMILGYEYAIKEQVAILIHARYTFIADSDISFHGIGASFGLSFRLW